MVWLPVLLLAFGFTWVAFRRRGLSTPWHYDVAALCLLGLAVLGFFWRVVAGRNWMPADGGDLVSFLFPTYRFAAASLRSGTWPLWNSYLYGGAPHVGDVQAGFLYPPNLLLFLVRPDFAYEALEGLSIGHLWLAGAGMYLLLARQLRLRRVAAVTGALAFMFSDAFLVHFGNLNFNAVASWLPWVFWAYLAGLKPLEPVGDGADERGFAAGSRTAFIGPLRFWLVIWAGVLLAIATLAGHIQATLFIALALAAYSVLWLWLQREEPGSLPRLAGALAALAACLLVGALLAAPILLPALQLSSHTVRAGWSYQETAGYSLSPAQWIGWLIPGYFGRGPQFHWGPWPRVEVGYLGVLPLILAGLALALRRDRRTWAWFGLAVASFVVGLGIYAIVHGWLTLLPGFRLLRAPARMVVVTDFALAILAAIGLDAALAPLEGRERAAFERVWRLTAYATGAVLAVAVPLAYMTLLLVQGRDEAIVMRVSIILIAVMAFAGLLAGSLFWLTARRGAWARPVTLGWLAAALVFLDLAAVGAYQDVGEQDPSLSFQQPAIASFLASQPGPYRIDARTEIDDLWQPDTALLYGWDDVGGLVNPLLLADAARYWEGLGSRSSRLYDLLNARYVIARKDVTLDWDKFKLAFDGDPSLNVYENTRALPRAFVVGNVQPAPDHEAAWAAIHEPAFDPGSQAVVEGGAPAGGGTGQVTALGQGPGRVSVETASDGPAVLVVSQMWYPGWQVWIDGAPSEEPLRADYAFQGVALPPGSHRIELVFRPDAWRLGWILAGGTVLVLIVGAVLSSIRRYHAH